MPVWSPYCFFQSKTFEFSYRLTREWENNEFSSHCKSIHVRLRIMIVVATSQATRWMRHRALELGCQKKLKFTTNQSRIEPQKRRHRNVFISLTMFFVVVFILRGFSMKNHKSQFSCQHVRRLRWQTLAPCPSPATCSVVVSFLIGNNDDTHALASRWRINYFHKMHFSTSVTQPANMHVSELRIDRVSAIYFDWIDKGKVILFYAWKNKKINEKY